MLCAPCHRYFPTQHALEQHLQSSKHRCELCNIFFKSAHSKSQHINSSRTHLRQASGDESANTFLQTPPANFGVKSHQRPAMILSATADNPAQPYTGIPRALVTPVFRMACRLRYSKPDVEMLLSHVSTQLDSSVISALIEAALRLLPPESTSEGKAEAIERMKQKGERALLHEVSFIDQVREFGHQFLTENEQKKKQLCPTPDIRFHEPVLIQGHLCHWIEYKSYFGFKSNPFIASKDKKQFKRYASELGPGAVVYKLGFETEHIITTEICFFREAEVLHLLGSS